MVACLKNNKVADIHTFQRQPQELLKKRKYSLKYRQIHRKTPVSDSFFINKIAGLRPATLFKKRL